MKIWSPLKVFRSLIRFLACKKAFMADFEFPIIKFFRLNVRIEIFQNENHNKNRPSNVKMASAGWAKRKDVSLKTKYEALIELENGKTNKEVAESFGIPQNTVSRWMDLKSFEDWVRDLDGKFGSQKRKIALVMDNCPAHPEVTGLDCVELIFLHPNTT